MQLIQDSKSYPLLPSASKRAMEQSYQARLPEHFLMQTAGLRVAQLAQALQAHAQIFWLVCGPGNNGGDGLIAACCLHQKGKKVRLTYCGDSSKAPIDAAWALAKAQSLGIHIETQIPEASFLDSVDCVIDAMLGIGATRPLQGLMAECAAQINQLNAFVLAVDIPSGLVADTGAVLTSEATLTEKNSSDDKRVIADATLALIALSAGLFTASGKDVAGDVWLDELVEEKKGQLNGFDFSPIAFLAAAPQTMARPNSSHKGSFGAVAVIAGAEGMQGAAILAATAALKAGAGKVYLSLLSPTPCSHPIRADLMQRTVSELALTDSKNLKDLTVVAGCGGGHQVAEVLPLLLANAERLVLDADALNRLAERDDLQEMLKMRAGLGLVTVLTPHPKEAALLLKNTTEWVQNNRIQAVQQIANRFHVVVVLKGSGSLIAAPFVAPTINTSGNAKLATAGTGDVLAGMVGAAMAQGLSAFEAARVAVYWHGKIADIWGGDGTLTAFEMLDKIHYL